VTQARLAADLTSDAVLYALAASAAFLAFAALLDPKLFRTPIGRTLILLDAGLVLLYVPSVLHRFFGLGVASVGFAWFYLGVLLLVGSAVWWRTVIMIRAQRRGKEGTGK
jgi:hypothetical protein